MQKTKLKIALFAVLSVVGIIIGYFFSGYLNLLLTSHHSDALHMLHPAAIWESVITNERHRMLLLCVELIIVAGAAVITLMNRRETFESDTSKIAGGIQTPVAIGQGQHGTARWLRMEEWKKAFAIYRMDTSNAVFAALMREGARDREKVEAYGKTSRQ